MSDLEKRVGAIEERNRRVELEKAWEVSRTRWVTILVITYVLAVLVMYALEISAPFKNALIPTLGYFLSVQSLPIIKKWWMRGK